MRRRLLLMVLAGAVITASCASGVGPGSPECARDSSDEIATATFVQLQAVPSAQWGPCIEELRLGWEYVPQFVESGRAVFWLNSDRVGDRFVEVALKESCDPGLAHSAGVPEEGIVRFVRVDEEPGEVEIAVIPVAPRHEGDARALVVSAIGRIMEGRRVVLHVDESEGPAAERIQAALRRHGIVMILDDPEVTTDTVELRRVGHDPRVGIGLEEALEEIADDLDAPAYRAQWFHVFSGGCIIYTFDAKGLGSDTIASEVQDALGFYPLGNLREVMERLGLEV